MRGRTGHTIMARVLDDPYLSPPKTGQIITVRVFDGQGLDRVFDGL